MSTVTIIGTGNMGTAIATLLGKAGVSVQSIAHEQWPTIVDGDVVVLAVPYTGLADIAETGREQLAGKIVVDITNPVDFAAFAPITVAAGSAAEELAAALPDPTVVKAFNTNFAATLASGQVHGAGAPVVLVAGDDEQAKRTVVDAVSAGGATGLDAGPLARARQLEALGYLQMGLAMGEQIPWTGGFTVAR